MKYFLHGLESSSSGAKASFLRDLYPEMVIPDFTGSLVERMRALDVILAGRTNITLVGSSFGGLMAVIFAMENNNAVDRLVLLAPALNFPDFSHYAVKRIQTPTWMIIGRNDIVTPAAEVVPIARKIFINLHHEEVNDDHILAATFRSLAWNTMLGG